METKMDNWKKVENDAPAVLRALADGRKVRVSASHAPLYIDQGHICSAGEVVEGRMHLGGTWYIEPARDIATDPQVGDEFMWFKDRCKVLAVAGGGVMWVEADHDGGTIGALSLTDWVASWVAHEFKRLP